MGKTAHDRMTTSTLQSYSRSMPSTKTEDDEQLTLTYEEFEQAILHQLQEDKQLPAFRQLAIYAIHAQLIYVVI